MNKFQEVIDLQNEITKKLETFGKQAFIDGFAPMFAANPAIDGIIWTQYTPYFNDGDACTFCVHEPAFILTEVAAREMRSEEDWDDYDAEDFGWDSLRRCDVYELPDDFDKGGFSEIWNQIPESIFQAVFGDHVEVRIMRDGTVTVEDYQHD